MKDQRYRTAITKLRASSHILEIERGWYSKPMVPSHLRMCKKCNMVEDEEHFVTKCVININELSQLLAKVRCIFPDIDLLYTRQIFVFLMCSADKQIQKWFGRFIHQSFITRNERLLWYIPYFISIEIVVHVIRSWISCHITSITYITISVTTIENLCIYYTFICCIDFITVYTGIRVVALGALSSLAALGVVYLTTPGALAMAGCVVVAEAFYFGASFLCVLW